MKRRKVNGELGELLLALFFFIYIFGGLYLTLIIYLELLTGN